MINKGLMSYTVHQVTSGALRAEIVEEPTPRGCTFAVVIHRLGDHPEQRQLIFSGRSEELHDLRAVLEQAIQTVEFCLNGGDVRLRRGGSVYPAIPVI